MNRCGGTGRPPTQRHVIIIIVVTDEYELCGRKYLPA